MPFVPHQTIPGVSPEAAQALLEIQRQIGQDLDDLRRGPKVSSLQRANYTATENEYVRCAPPAGGMTITLPLSRPQNQGQNIRVLIETVLAGGGVSISPTRGTINGLPTINLTTVGLVEFTSDGLGNWLSAWAPGTTGTPPGVAGTMLATQSPPGQPAEVRRPPVIPGPRGLTGKAAAASPPGVPGSAGWRSSIVPGVLPVIQRGSVLGTQIDSDNSNDQAHRLSGAEVGELLRLAHIQDAAGAVGANDNFALDVRTKIVRINPGLLGGDVSITGFALNGGGTTANTGGFFVLVKQGASNSVTLKNEDTGSSGNNRLELPRSQDYIMTTANECLLIWYWGGRWQILGPMTALTAGAGILISAAGVVTVDQGFSPTWTDAHVFSAPIISDLELLTNGTVAQNGVASASISASQTNWNPTGLSSCSVLRVTATVAALSIGGLVHFLDGARVLICNVGSEVFTILNEDLSTTAANRFSHNVDSFAIGPNDCVEVWYDNITSRWRCIHTSTSA